MSSRKRILLTGATVWLSVSWMASFACFETPPSNDGGDVLSADAGDGGFCTFGCIDSPYLIIDACSDAPLALRMRAMIARTCSGGPERGCHSELAGSTTLTLDPDSSAYSTYGVINIPSIELPDVLRVEPFHPESSYVYWKVSGDPRIPDGAGVMPLANAADYTSGTVVSCYQSLVGAWIEAGAP